MTSFRWLTVAAAERNCKLNCFFPNFSSDRFIKHYKIQPSNTCNCIFISFTVHRIIMVYNSCFAVCNFSFYTVCTRDTHPHSPKYRVVARGRGSGAWHPHLKSVPPYFTFDSPVAAFAAYIQYCISKMRPLHLVFGPPAAKSWRRACLSSRIKLCKPCELY